MTTFEKFVLIFYFLFAFEYMVNTFGIKESDSILFRLLLILMSLTLGIIWFPMVLGIDVYNKLHK